MPKLGSHINISVGKTYTTRGRWRCLVVYKFATIDLFLTVHYLDCREIVRCCRSDGQRADLTDSDYFDISEETEDKTRRDEQEEAKKIDDLNQVLGTSK